MLLDTTVSVVPLRTITRKGYSGTYFGRHGLYVVFYSTAGGFRGTYLHFGWT